MPVTAELVRQTSVNYQSTQVCTADISVLPSKYSWWSRKPNSGSRSPYLVGSFWLNNNTNVKDSISARLNLQISSKRVLRCNFEDKSESFSSFVLRFFFLFACTVCTGENLYHNYCCGDLSLIGLVVSHNYTKILATKHVEHSNSLLPLCRVAPVVNCVSA